MTANIQLERLRNAMSKGMRPEESLELSAIEKRIKLLEGYQSLANHSSIKDFISWCKLGITEINDRLTSDRELSKSLLESERLALFDKKDILMYFVSLFDPSAELDSLDKELADRAESFEQYQGDRP